jgi:hypothetical protein
MASILAAMAANAIDVSGFMQVLRAARPAAAIRLSAVTVKDLRLAQRSANVVDLLELAETENRLGLTPARQLLRGYQAVEKGDEFLLRCLQVPACEPARFLKTMQTSPLHAQVALRNPGLDAVQVNHQVGQISENLMTRYFGAGKWEQMEGQIGRTGIDGLFVFRKDGVIRDLLVVESKYNGSLLGETNHGTQMSKDWILRKLVELQSRYPENPDYSVLERLVSADAYRAILWQLEVKADELQVALRRMHSKDSVVVQSPLLSEEISEFGAKELERIRLRGDRSAFEIQMGNWYEQELAAVPKG